MPRCHISSKLYQRNDCPLGFARHDEDTKMWTETLWYGNYTTTANTITNLGTESSTILVRHGKWSNMLQH